MKKVLVVFIQSLRWAFVAFIIAVVIAALVPAFKTTHSAEHLPYLKSHMWLYLYSCIHVAIMFFVLKILYEIPITKINIDGDETEAFLRAIGFFLAIFASICEYLVAHQKSLLNLQPGDLHIMAICCAICAGILGRASVLIFIVVASAATSAIISADAEWAIHYYWFFGKYGSLGFAVILVLYYGIFHRTKIEKEIEKGEKKTAPM
jgi:hypothetical protein